MLEEIEAKIEKWLEPPPPKLHKALPLPREAPQKKRGPLISVCIRVVYVYMVCNL